MLAWTPILTSSAITGSIKQPITRSASACTSSGLPRLRHQDGELVTAEPGQRRALGQLRGHPACYLAQQAVADVVAEGVVHLLEVVQVEQHHREPAADGRGQIDRPLGAPAEQFPVRQVGQPVVQGVVSALRGDPGVVLHPDQRQHQQRQHQQREVRDHRRDRTEAEQDGRRQALHPDVLAQHVQHPLPAVQGHHDRHRAVVDQEVGGGRGQRGQDVVRLQPRGRLGERALGDQREHQPGGQQGEQVLPDVEHRVQRPPPPPDIVEADREGLRDQRQRQRSVQHQRHGEGGGDSHPVGVAVPAGDQQRSQLADHQQDGQQVVPGHRPGQPVHPGQLVDHRPGGAGDSDAEHGEHVGRDRH